MAVHFSFGSPKNSLRRDKSKVLEA